MTDGTKSRVLHFSGAISSDTSADTAERLSLDCCCGGGHEAPVSPSRAGSESARRTPLLMNAISTEKQRKASQTKELAQTFDQPGCLLSTSHERRRNSHLRAP